MDSRFLTSTDEAALEQAHAGWQRSKEALELAGHEYARTKRLLPTKAVPVSDFDSAEHVQQIATADVPSTAFAVKVAGFEVEHAQSTIQTQTVSGRPMHRSD